MATITGSTTRQNVVGSITRHTARRMVSAKISDPNSMFTDASGTTTVSSVGDPVGLIKTEVVT